jgi:hypothetical protein
MAATKNKATQLKGNISAKGQGLDGNPQNINRKGRPRGIPLVNRQLQEKGYEPATKQEIEVTYMQLMNLSESELKNLAQDKDQPMLIRILIKNMLGGKGFDVVEKMLDRGVGKSTIKDDKGKALAETNIVVQLPKA